MNFAFGICNAVEETRSIGKIISQSVSFTVSRCPTWIYIYSTPDLSQQTGIMLVFLIHRAPVRIEGFLRGLLIVCGQQARNC